MFAYVIFWLRAIYTIKSLEQTEIEKSLGNRMRRIHKGNTSLIIAGID
jgi:hypothetical protein